MKNYRIALLLTLAVASLLAMHLNPFGTRALWERTMLREFRIPRVLMALMLGSGMALSGWVAQKATRNPLASPDILTVPAAAAFGVILVLWLSGGALLSSYTLPVAAAVSGVLSASLVFGLAGRRHRLDGSGLLLAGIAMGSLLSAAGLFVALNASPSTYQYALGLLTGSLGRASWEYVWMLAPAWWALTFTMACCARRFDVLMFDDQTVASFGGRADLWRRLALCMSAALGAVCVGVGGNLAFLGFAAPHLVKRMSGRVLEPAWVVCAMGALLLMVSDLAGQTLVRPGEIPAGIVTTAVGAPLFVLLLLRRKAIQ